MNSPLGKYRVIDLTRFLSGPFCTMMLGDLGADVIKVEPLEGDSIRHQAAGRNGMSWYFATFNRNKRSVALDLKSQEGRKVLEKLIESADVLIENFRPGVLDRMGFSAERLQQLRPGLVTCSISGFGPSGPYRDRPAFDFIAQAMSGFMSTNGRDSDPPLRSGIPISDLVAGLYAALSIVSALLRRENGQSASAGERIDIGLTTSMVSLLAYLATHYFATGEVLRRTGNDHPISSPYGLFQTRDQAIAIAPSNSDFFHRLAKAIGLAKLADDPDFATQDLRVKHRNRLNYLIEEQLKTADAAHWIERLNAAGVPCGPVYDVAGVFSDPQIQTQDMRISAEHPIYGEVEMLGFPMKFTHAPCGVRRPPPLLNEHLGEILTELGFGDDEREKIMGMNTVSWSAKIEDKLPAAPASDSRG